MLCTLPSRRSKMARSNPTSWAANVPSEHEEQTRVIFWWRHVGCLHWRLPQHLLFAIPNGGKRGKITAARLSAEGVMPGVPDLFLAVTWCPGDKKWPGLWIEMKKRAGGRLSTAQQDMIYFLSKQGYQVAVCYGADQAVAAINSYLTTLEENGWPGGNGAFDAETGEYLPH